MTYETMEIEPSEDGAATLWFNRPEARNAVSLRFCEELSAAVDELIEADQARVILLRGRGPVSARGVA